MNYTNVKVSISDGQKEKLKSALQSGEAVSIRLSHHDLNGEDVLALTKAQVTKLTKAYQNGKGVTIKMSKTQIRHNLKEFFFLPMLAGLAATVAPILFKTVLPALHKYGCVKVETDGKGLYLGQASGSNFQAVGDGLYLKKEGVTYDGRGLLLGKNSPFKSIPILGMLL
ncbi:hypothetical protein MAR_010300 [Mya arenaria]|uniref:Uncharacterized protein n=1 Tax=Mya arenaria TaxID=6604 RepID=A0ABY7E174_MYAAR|nr:hypothetical protein MAR_010300 [Mya arenaria]